VARLEGRGGNVNKRIRGLTCAQPAASGDRILAGADGALGEDVGYITSAGESPEFGAIAMGYVHRSRADRGTRVSLRGGTAEVVDLPFKA
jgi:glycine cleavage system aminomethyltransferase T